MGFSPEIPKLLFVLLNLASCPAPCSPPPWLQISASPFKLTRLIIKADLVSLEQAC